MKRKYDRTTSTQKAIRFQDDVHDLIDKSPVAGETFSQKLHRFVRKHGKKKPNA